MLLTLCETAHSHRVHRRIDVVAAEVMMILKLKGSWEERGQPVEGCSPAKSLRTRLAKHECRGAALEHLGSPSSTDRPLESEGLPPPP